MPRTIVKQSPISDEISRRFFVAIDALKAYRLIHALDSFCNEYGLSSPRYREMRLQYGVTPTPGRVSRYKNIELEAIYALVANFPISANWLVTGRGEMLTWRMTNEGKH